MIVARHSTSFTQTWHHATLAVARGVFLLFSFCLSPKTICQIYSWTISSAVLQHRNGPTVGNTISFSDDMCPIIRSSTQPQVIPNSPTFHHKTSCGTDTYRMINDFAPKATNFPHCSLHFDNQGVALKCSPRVTYIAPHPLYILCWGSCGESVFMRFLPIS